jgi:hypothetical protein
MLAKECFTVTDFEIHLSLNMEKLDFVSKTYRFVFQGQHHALINFVFNLELFLV